MIKGISIVLYERVEISRDPFNAPVYEEIPITVNDVLVAPMSDEEIVNTLNLTGRKAKYQLAIPKGDEHDWANKRVRFFGEDWRVIGHGVQGIEANIPLRWNRKIQVESYVESRN